MSSSTDPADDVNEQLIIAASKGCEATVRLLIDAGTEVNAQNGNGDTALSCVMKGFPVDKQAIVRLLVDAGEDVNLQDDKGWTALMFVIRNGGEHALLMMYLLLDN